MTVVQNTTARSVSKQFLALPYLQTVKLIGRLDSIQKAKTNPVNFDAY